MENSAENSVFEDIGKLEVETEALRKEIENCDEKEEVVVGFLSVLGKILKRVFEI